MRLGRQIPIFRPNSRLEDLVVVEQTNGNRKSLSSHCDVITFESPELWDDRAHVSSPHDV
jgi:hypothetical protein